MGLGWLLEVLSNKLPRLRITLCKKVAVTLAEETEAGMMDSSPGQALD